MSVRAKPRVVVGMSGGLDSSVGASLLVDRGCDVIGVTMRMLPDSTGPSVFEPCCTLEAVETAREVAGHLGIVHEIVRVEDRFEQEVVAGFISEYRAGRTPNPCMWCNRRIKFSVLYERAAALGAEYVATGHYARLVTREGRLAVRRASYPDKDQSYVLAALTQGQLAHMLFPMGELSKEDARRYAEGLGLPTAKRPESQDVCFVPGRDYREFLTARLGEPEPGPILSANGELLGRHKGLMYYTVGQRRGLGIASPRPYYVLRLDAGRNTLIVGHEEETYCQGVHATSVNWSGMAPQTRPFECHAQIRYRHTPGRATATPVESGFSITFSTPQQSPAPGQWAVLYDDDGCVLVAGIIDRPV